MSDDAGVVARELPAAGFPQMIIALDKIRRKEKIPRNFKKKETNVCIFDALLERPKFDAYF